MEVGHTSPVLTSDEHRFLELLRTKGLSIKNLDPETRRELRDCLSHLHHEKGLSLSDLAKLIGNKTSGDTSWLYKSLGVPVRPFEESRLKAIREKRRKYGRKPFDGTDEDRAYMLGLRHGDLSVSRPWGGVVRVSTSTTHPAMAELFHTLFGRYGHVYQHPRYKKDTESYEWNLSTILDSSLGFLLDGMSKSWAWVLGKKEREIAYLAGVTDAEGHIGIFRNYKTVAIIVSIYNTNSRLLLMLKSSMGRLGYRVLGPYLDKPKGSSGSKYRIMRKKDYWRIAVADFDMSQALLVSLPIRHPEKLVRKRLALTLRKGARWEDVKPRIARIREQIHSGRDAFVEGAAELAKSKPERKL